MKLFGAKKNWSSLILLLVYIILSAILAYVYFTKSGYAYEKFVFKELFLYIILTTTLCFIVLVHIGLCSRHYFIIALSTLFLFLFLSEISYSIYYGQIISDGVLDSIVETNSHEALSMSKQVLIITGPAFIATFLILFIFRKVVSVKFRPLIPLTVYLLILVIICTMAPASITKNEIKLGHYKNSADIVRRFYPAALGNLSYLLVSYTSTDIYSNIHEIEKFNEAVLLPPNKSDKDLIVFIMGESSLVTRYSAYGYHKQTTPFMTNIFSQNGGCIIQNSHSTAAFTRDSIPMTLSFSVPESSDNLFNNKSIIEMAKFNHYKTYWLASIAQEIQGSFNTKFGFIARKSDVVSFSDKKYDISLSQLLEATLQNDNSPKKFIFVHLRGSHKPYENYDEVDKQALPDVEEYDLTIHHTDRTIKALYDVINKYSDNYTVIYTSDHGEIVNVGHGIGNNPDQFLIPFMFTSTNHHYDCQFIESFRGSTGYLSGLMNKYILSILLGYNIDQTILEKEKSNDRVFMPDGNVMPFLEVLNKH
ncbi:phosphoethanolamine transferase [Gilliamella sp. ESL0250]|uniref:phosphoethanolamine transferase n=1 Tax=Gilliamella sp. ESL0250 TaxID=2705036 RepID=UPI001581022B|nr:phosphoethanolamine transferase [Gilliamella sp. ESL0250]NUF48509.1 phosphoethanolamine transferase [Gilliamella sp. ESL0250]